MREKTNCSLMVYKLSRGATHVAMHNNTRKIAFTLAEVLITLGIIGVVAAVVLPTLLTNVQERVRNEQVRTAKYKITQATDKMKSMGLLQESYATTEDFINEFKKHYKIAKVCDNSHLRDCWGSDSFEAYIDNTDTIGPVSVNSLTTGEKLVALAPGTKNTTTMGIVTADGTPMIVVYSPKCSPLEPAQTFTWSTIDNKPETNPTANCFSAIMDVNGKAKPNRMGQDVRTFNALLGYRYLSTSYDSMSYANCEKEKKKLGLQYCITSGKDYYAGARKACSNLGLHLPSLQTLANVAGSRYGISNVGPTTYITSSKYAGYNSCNEYYASQTYKSNLKTYGSVVCIDTGASNTITTDTATSLPDTITSVNSYFCSASEVSAAQSQTRRIHTGISNRDKRNRNTSYRALCLGD